MINIGDKLFQVNRDDRTHGVDDHLFNELECKGIFKINDIVTIRYLGKVIDLHSTPKESYEHMRRIGQTTSTYFDHPNQTIVTMHDNFKDLLNDLSELEHRKYYSEKVDARDELIDLLSGQLEAVKRRKESIDGTIESMEKTLKELSEPNEDLGL